MSSIKRIPKRAPLFSRKGIKREYEIVREIELCKGCDICVVFCPKDVLEMDTDSFNRRGYHYLNVVKDEDCTECFMCERICPELAIHLRRKEE